MAGSVPMCLLEYEGGRLEWRRVEDGAIMGGYAGSTHRQALLDTAHWPQWYWAMDDTYVDVGI